MKINNIFILLILSVFLLSACNSETPPLGIETDPVTSVAQQEETTLAPVGINPSTDDELFDFIISKWQQNKAAELYEYTDAELISLLSEKDFAYLFDSVSKIGGNLKSFSDKRSSSDSKIVTYTAKLDFDNITADLTVSFRNLKICAFTRNLHFKNTFEIDHGNGVTERYFVFENDGYKFNAVYTYINDGDSHPAVFMIAGSGSSDYNETLGILTPFEDIALGLAENGICSLRIDKRTLNYASEFDVRDGINEEYLSDCIAAIEYLKNQSATEIYLFGHSLGGQIATEIAANTGGIDGMILFNSSARHLADIACDQYSSVDPENTAIYTAYANAAKSAMEPSAQGNYFYGATDYYWASYNRIDTAKNISDANVRTLIINSKNDSQTFDEDIDMWNSLFAGSDNVTVFIYDDISHFGYKIDTSDASSLYKRIDFPNEIISRFTAFIYHSSTLPR